MKKEFHTTSEEMKRLLPGERPYEIAWNAGVERLTDVQLLAVILRTGTQSISAQEVARNVLANSPRGSLNILYHLSKEQLCEIKGIGRVKAIQLKAVAELSRRIAREEAVSSVCFTDPVTIAAFYMEQLRHCEEERVIEILLGSGGEFLGDRVVSIGTATASPVSPREVFIEALRARALSVVLLHNHPSGKAVPSREDAMITARIRRSGLLIGIELVDHIIIGDGEYFSFREAGLL